MSGPMDRLTALDQVEKDILSCLQCAGQVLNELSKDKPSAKAADTHTNNFLKTLNNVEVEMTKHVNYLTQVSTGQAHEGSSYASQKVLQMAWHRSEHARSKVLELERNKNQMLAATRQLTAAQQKAPVSAGPSTPTSTGMTSHGGPPT
ncbi:unnamed protein product [Orchesella dallaii]|uniref:Mediator of RNA polymerase II transcription subunit 11 n=1 Tax=Orchesella dallaii TaxID=48710 RepID=A0ABP1R8J7_9HEXA